MKYFIVLPAFLLTFSGFTPEKADTVSRKPVCPVCRSAKNSIPIVYGRPASVAIKRAEKGELKLGGCIVGPDAPKHYCKKDQQSY